MLMRRWKPFITNRRDICLKHEYGIRESVQMSWIDNDDNINNINGESKRDSIRKGKYNLPPSAATAVLEEEGEEEEEEEEVKKEEEEEGEEEGGGRGRRRRS
ncbi:Hypothetical predicted protein [Octopus vulgaris]|uniref:Uncharacterized protein n=1 Tax=Octopus vulgaris TaxID=6645 RepID=A0AA36BBX4_OCTVU|nr:Hypothetical predicted protein [Octopus vulgaris]